MREQLWKVRHPVHIACMGVPVMSARLLKREASVNMRYAAVQIHAAESAMALRIACLQHDKLSTQLVSDLHRQVSSADEALHCLSLRASREISPIMHMPRNVSLGWAAQIAIQSASHAFQALLPFCT